MAISRPKNSRRRRGLTLVIVALAVIYAGLVLVLPVKALSSPQASSTLAITTPPSNLPWPQNSESAVGIVGSGVIATHGPQTPRAIASNAKLITALAVLKKYPLVLGQQGPMITLGSTDYAIYTKYISEQGSVVPVYNGEQLSEYQMLEAMLVPSGDNIADSLARWAFGSISSYINYANELVKQLGLNNTHVGGDASGLSPDTTSTASNLIMLGADAMANPVIAQIVAMKSVDVPNVGVMNNYDTILGTDGIVGIKTGNSNQAGGIFLGAADSSVNGHPVTILTAVMGAPSLNQALSDSVPLVISLENDFNETVLINKGEVVGEYREPWGGYVQILAGSNLDTYVIQGQTVKVKLSLKALAVPSVVGSSVGTATSNSSEFSPAVSIPLVTEQGTTEPSLIWRLSNPGAIF